MEIDCLNAIGLNISTVIKGRELLGTGSGSSLYTTYNGNYGRMKIDIGQVRQTGTGYAFRNGNGSQGKSLSAIFGYVESAASYGIYTGGGTLICDYVYGGGTAGIAFSGGSGDEASFMGETNKLIISGGQEVNFNGYVNDTATISQVSSRLVGGTCYKLVLTDGYADTTVEFNATITAGQARLKRVDDSSTPKIICNGGVTHILDDVYGGGSIVSQATGVIAINNDAKLFLHGYNVMDGANNWKFISMNHADCIVDLLGSTIDLQGTVSLNREVSGIDYKAGTLISNGATILTNGQGIPIKTASASDELIMKGTLNTNYLGTLETGNIKRKKFIPSNVATTTISLDDTTGGAEVFSETDTVTYNTKALLSERMVQLINASGTLDITASQDTPFTDEYFYLDGDIAGLEWVESIFANLAAEYVTVGTAGFTKIGGGTVVQHANII
jgi:hypothetical protein